MSEGKQEQKDKKATRRVSPVGELRWCHLNKPRKAYDETGKPRFEAVLVFDPKAQGWPELITELNERIKALPPKKDKDGERIKPVSPLKRELDENEKPTGKVQITFRSGADYPPSVYDRFGRPLPEGVKIGNGSRGRVAYTVNEFDGFGGGVNLYMNAVQVLELVEYVQDAKAFGFTCEEAPSEDNPM